MKRVIIESPFAGDVERNLRYLRACMHHCITRDEAPYASHALYTQPGVLDDTIPSERELGIIAGFAWRDVADLTVVYTDLGITSGMQAGIDDARRWGCPVEYRQLTGVGVERDDGLDRGADRELRKRLCLKRTWCIREDAHDGNCHERTDGAPPAASDFGPNAAKRRRY